MGSWEISFNSGALLGAIALGGFTLAALLLFADFSALMGFLVDGLDCTGVLDVALAGVSFGD